MNKREQNLGFEFGEACDFIIKLGKAAHGYGSTPGRLEVYLTRITQVLGFKGAFRITSADMFCAFQEANQPQQMHMEIMPVAGLDLSKLAMVGELVEALEAKNISFAGASIRLDEIQKTPMPWGRFANALGYALTGTGLAVLFSLTWWDVLFSALFSLVVYWMVLLSGCFGFRTAEWLPVITSFVVAALAAAAKIALPQLNLVLVILAAMTTGQVATGEQQFAQMFVVALTIAAGLLIGNTIIKPKATL